MAKKKQRFYAVWQGLRPGVYSDWDECRRQVQGVQGAQYKAFDSLAEAEQALRLPYSAFATQRPHSEAPRPRPAQSALYVDDNGLTAIRPGINNPPLLDALAVDAACSGNPGVMEYQGVYVATRTRVFHYRAERGTNNIGEFLAIVHGLSYMKKHGLNQIIYSDSANAMLWVRQKTCKSKLPLDSRTAELWDYVHRAENWLRQNRYTTEVRKWDTENWGEIPADFGRK